MTNYVLILFIDINIRFVAQHNFFSTVKSQSAVSSKNCMFEKIKSEMMDEAAAFIRTLISHMVENKFPKVGSGNIKHVA